ncbi:MAG TPA: hemolysin III family protein [Gemmatales bacterium]|nr:hemolysin III family protein [Gemmatales bacterium]
MPEGNLPLWGLRDPVSMLSHALAAGLGVGATIWLVRCSGPDRPKRLSLLVFGLSWVLLYSASATYHALTLPHQHLRFFRLLDHSAIFLLIAGTYTPLLVVLRSGRRGTRLMVAGMWFVAGLGIAAKWFLPELPHEASVVIYLLVGWIGLVPVMEMTREHGLRMLSQVFYGGVIYSIGGLIELAERPTLVPRVVGPHEVFHFCVMLGTWCHFLFMLQIVAPARTGVVASEPRGRAWPEQVQQRRAA